ncbi:MAG: GNAT family protein [Candidatus Kapaibacterium sp.]
MSELKKVLSQSVREATSIDAKSIAQYWSNLSFDDAFKLGIDFDKIPPTNEIIEFIEQQISLQPNERNTYILIWEADGIAIGHCNITPIVVGEYANIHSHIWDKKHIAKGMGERLMRMSLPIFFEKYNLEKIYGVFYALNPAPEKLCIKLGFSFVDEYPTIPGEWSFYQNVKKYVLGRNDLKF